MMQFKYTTKYTVCPPNYWYKNMRTYYNYHIKPLHIVVNEYGIVRKLRITYIHKDNNGQIHGKESARTWSTWEVPKKYNHLIHFINGI